MSVGAVNKQTGDRIPTAGMPAIDSVLSGSSTNPVQNRVVKAALDEKADTELVASDFDATASYTAGNYCIYEGKFYRFKNNHSGAWAAADVDEIQIAGELSSIKSDLTNLADVSVYTTDSALITDFRGKHDYYRTLVMSDSTKTMALLNAVNEEKVYVVLVENQQMWRNHPNFYAFLQDEVWVGILNIGENSVSVSVLNKLVKSSDNNLTTTEKTVIGAINELNGIFIHHDFSGPDTKEIITSLIAFIRDNTQTGHTYVLDGLFTNTTTTTTHNYNAVVTKMSSYVYGIVSYGNNIYNIDYLAGTYKTIMQFTGTAL